MKTILFLEGEKGTDFQEDFDSLVGRGFEVSILDNLYYEPEKLKQIKKLNPDCLFIGTTGVRTKEREQLVSIFQSLKYVPKNVMFAGEHSAMVYLGLSRELKRYGTKFYFSPSPYDKEDEICEIEWI
mgnify:CR=1 FL=1